jgi:DNA-binding CsgD family transcriptional regulator
MRQKVDLLERRIALLDELLEGLSVAVIAVSADGRIMFANGAGEAQMRAGEGILNSHGNLRPQHPHQTAALSLLIRSAAMNRASATRSGGQINLVCSNGTELPVLITPLTQADVHCRTPLHAATLLFANRRKQAILPKSLSRRFGLTPAQANLLAALINGHSLADYARDRNVSVGTVRTHLKQLFAKTGQRRQSDLIRLVLLDPLARLSLR